MADEKNHYDSENPEVHHEESDINVRAVMVGIVIVAVLAVIMHVGLWGMYVLFRKIDRSFDPTPATAITEPATSAAMDSDFTVHWSEPAKYLEVIREDNRKILEEYGWVNRAAGKVHVPIEVGMQMALERGYPTRGSKGEPVIGTGEATTDAPWVGDQTDTPAASRNERPSADAGTGSGETAPAADAADEQSPAVVDPDAGLEQGAGRNR